MESVRDKLRHALFGYEWQELYHNIDNIERHTALEERRRDITDTFCRYFTAIALTTSLAFGTMYVAGKRMPEEFKAANKVVSEYIQTGNNLPLR